MKTYFKAFVPGLEQYEEAVVNTVESKVPKIAVAKWTQSYLEEANANGDLYLEENDVINYAWIGGRTYIGYVNNDQTDVILKVEIL